MTHAQVFDSLDFLLDKSQAPVHDGFEKEFLLYDGLLEWIKIKYKDFEQTEKSREDLDLILVRKKSFASMSVINLNSVPEFFLALSLSGKWNFICNNKTTLREIPIEPATHDELKVIANDPHNCPTDAFPRYEQYHDGTNPVLKLHSDNLPDSIELVYVKLPGKILSSTPLAICELPDWIMHEALRHSVRIALGVTENYQRYKQQIEVEMPLNK